MWLEYVAGTTNVLRFPVERRARPTLQRMRELAPDVDDVLAIVAAYDLAAPTLGLRERAAAEMVECLQNQDATGRSTRPAELQEALDAMIGRAIALCWSVRDGTTLLEAAQQRLVLARRTGQGWVGSLRASVEALKVERAKLLVQAYVHVEEVEGVAQAVADVLCRDPGTLPIGQADADGADAEPATATAKAGTQDRGQVRTRKHAEADVIRLIGMA